MTTPRMTLDTQIQTFKFLYFILKSVKYLRKKKKSMCLIDCQVLVVFFLENFWFGMQKFSPFTSFYRHFPHLNIFENCTVVYNSWNWPASNLLTELIEPFFGVGWGFKIKNMSIKTYNFTNTFFFSSKMKYKPYKYHIIT